MPWSDALIGLEKLQALGYDECSSAGLHSNINNFSKPGNPWESAATTDKKLFEFS